jgi:hypothetical protein
MKMTSCDYCGTTIVFGGVKEQGLNFCCKGCYHKGYSLVDIRKKIPQEYLLEQTKKIHHGQCPKCQGSGPVDVYISYRIYSLLLFTSWKSIPNVCCRSCGVKSQLRGLFFSLFFGWWGFPWGLLMTPLQIIRNISGMIKGSGITCPSEKLKNIVRDLMVQKLLEKQQGAIS